MKELWIEIDESIPEDVKANLLPSADQVCDVILTDIPDLEGIEKARIASSSEEGDITVLEVFDESRIKEMKDRGQTVAVKVNIKSKKDEDTAIKAAELSSDYIIIRCSNWKVIPLENLIAKTRGKSQLLAEVSTPEEAKLALETLELGADGVVLRTQHPKELMETADIAKKETPQVKLATVKVVNSQEIGTGARVCVDTCDIMSPGEGLLLGCQASALFLVQAEVRDTPYVEPRPFRVNAGPVSLYTLSSSNRSRYLSELKSGDEVLIVDREGKTRSTNVARVKIEWRPMILVEAEYQGKKIKTIGQNAETIRFVTEEGSKMITELNPGDKLLAHVVEGGRHFGTLVKEETVIER
ncbi:MAG: 3-dehydroquinate synthase II [Thermoproteota archaeon]